MIVRGQLEIAEVFFFHHEDSGGATEVARLGDKHPSLLASGRLIGLRFSIFFEIGSCSTPQTS